MLQDDYKAIIFAFRTTFFDHIDEHIQYPRSSKFNWMSRLSALTFANEKITITAERENFNLFSYENDRWTETVVVLRNSSHILIEAEQLFTVRNLKRDR